MYSARCIPFYEHLLKTAAYELTPTKKCKKHLQKSEIFTLYGFVQTDFDRGGVSFNAKTQRRKGRRGFLFM
jgi:hypothetical protein